MASRWFYLIPPVLFALLGAMMFWALTRDDPDALPSGFIGQPAPSVVELQPFGDEPLLDEAMLRAPGIKIVNYWASWCVPCRVEHPNIERLADMGLPVYGINYKDGLAQAQAFLTELGNPYAAIGADNGRTGVDWGVYGVPETYVIDNQGRVQLRHAGPITARILEADILPLIARLHDSVP